jgi:dienelactone hydrolase
MHVLVYDLGTTDYVAEAVAAVAALKARGAATITLAGASLGGTVALTAAGHGAGVAAVAALSADELTTPVSATAPRTVGEAAPLLKLPVYVAVADADPYVTVADEQALTKAMPGPVMFRPQPATAGHGWDMLGGPDQRTPLAAELAAFLQR